MSAITKEQLDAAKALEKWVDIELHSSGEFINALSALITLAQPIVDGTNVVVPREPTPEMIAAALASTAYHHNFEAQPNAKEGGMSRLNVNREKMKVRYRAMIKAAQEK